MGRLLTMLLVMSLAAVAVADVVYLSDGRQIAGTISKAGGKVTVKTPDGKTLTFPAAKVLYIASNDKNGKTTTTKPGKQARTQPKSIKPTKPTVPVSTARASMPETIVFNLLRHRPGGPGSGGAELEDSIRHFRAFVHDRRRKVNGKWLTPVDFTRRRRVFEKKLNCAAEDFRHVPASDSTKKLTNAETLEIKRYQASGRTKLRKAAGIWPDPLLRKFLLAEAARVSGDSSKAKAYFQQCVKDAPQIAAFQQGWALALMERKQYTEALKACMTLLELQPDSRDALDLLRKALEYSPGRDIRTGVYKQAADMLEQYDTGKNSRSRSSRKSKKSIGWLLPGKRVAAKENSLPSPPMDRMVFRQCIAVPITKNALLADSDMLDGACQIFVRINKNTFAPVAIRKKRRSGRGKKDTPPLTIIEVVGYDFTPVTATKDAKLSAEKSATAYGLNCLREMGGQVRTVPVKIKSVTIKGDVHMTAGLVAGEAAGPVFDRKGRLLGFLAGKTDAMADKTSNRLYTILDMEPLIKQAAKSSSRRAKRNKRNITPKAVKGNTFLVMVIVCERFDGKK